MNEEAYTVTQLTEIIASYINDDPYLTDIEVVGEVADVKVRGSHLFFALVDEESRVSCVMFGAGRWAELANGEMVRVRGDVRVYKKRGTYNLYVNAIRYLGSLGKYTERFSKLFVKLQKEGVFDKPKKPLPELPVRIGIITSLDSAALRDMLKTFREKAPLTVPRIFSAQVQGEEAPEKIVQAIKEALKEDLDAIIIARGGGSSDDLWVFNDERVIRTVLEVPFPVITGIGHAIDSVILDKIADVAAHTPTAAAEIIAQKQQEFFDRFESALERITYTFERIIEEKRLKMFNRLSSVLNEIELKVSAYYHKLLSSWDVIKRVSPFSLLEKKPHLKEICGRIFKASDQLVNIKKRTLENLIEVIHKVSPLRILERGFAILKKRKKVIKSTYELNVGDELEVIMNDGKVRVRVYEIRRDSQET